MDNIIFPIRVAKLMQMMPKHIFWLIIDCSSLYATGVTRIQGVVLRRIGECGHFRSRDKDGGHTIDADVQKIQPCSLRIEEDFRQWRIKHIYLPIRQRQTEKYRYIQRDTN